MQERKRRYEPVRRVIHRGSVIVNGRFASRKMGRCIPWEASIEKDFVHLLEFDREVEEYYAQPFWVPYALVDEEHKTCPDFLAIYTSGEEIVWEVKPDHVAQTDDFKDKSEAIAKVLERRGQCYHPVTDIEIRSGHRLENIKKLFAYLHVEPNLNDILALCRVFDFHEKVTIGDLMRGTYDQVFSQPVIYGLLAQRTLEMDIDGVLGDDTLVSDHSLYNLLSSE